MVLRGFLSIIDCLAFNVNIHFSCDNIDLYYKIFQALVVYMSDM